MAKKIYPQGLTPKEKKEFDAMGKITPSTFSRSKDLICAFKWSESPKGYDYWRKIYNRTNKNKI